jgi:hypothetical protein
MTGRSGSAVNGVQDSSDQGRVAGIGESQTAEIRRGVPDQIVVFERRSVPHVADPVC